MRIDIWTHQPFQHYEGTGVDCHDFYVEVPSASKLFIHYKGSYVIYYQIFRESYGVMQKIQSEQFAPNVQEFDRSIDVGQGVFNGRVCINLVETLGNPNPSGFVDLWIETTDIIPSACMIAFLFGSTALSKLFPYLRIFRDIVLPKIVIGAYYHFSYVCLHALNLL